MPALGLSIFVPTDDAERHRPDYALQVWEPFEQLSFGSFVDNISIAGSTVPAAMKLADAFQEELRVTWNQTIKPASKELSAPKGVSLSKVHLRTWSCPKNTQSLGVSIQTNSETDSTWYDAYKTAWNKSIVWHVPPAAKCSLQG